MQSEKNNSNPAKTTGPGGPGVVYNVTIKVEAAIATAWLQWLLHEHIPAVMATKCFEQYRVVRLLEVDESEGPTYAVQYRAADKAAYERYLSQFADGLRQQSFQKWGNRFFAFRTLMEIVG